jgi:hypothetical protein
VGQPYTFGRSSIGTGTEFPFVTVPFVKGRSTLVDMIAKVESRQKQLTSSLINLKPSKARLSQMQVVPCI